MSKVLGFLGDLGAGLDAAEAAPAVLADDGLEGPGKGRDVQIPEAGYQPA